MIIQHYLLLEVYVWLDLYREERVGQQVARLWLFWLFIVGDYKTLMAAVVENILCIPPRIGLYMKNSVLTVDFRLISMRMIIDCMQLIDLKPVKIFASKWSSALRWFQSWWNLIVCPSFRRIPTSFGVLLGVVFISWTLLQLRLKVPVFYRLNHFVIWMLSWTLIWGWRHTQTRQLHVLSTTSFDKNFAFWGS